jgi:predicted dehydrogenase
MKDIGLGLIGLGFIGKVHLRNSMRLTNSHVVAISDTSRRALNEARNTAGIKKTFVNYEQLLKDNAIDAVIIALPTHLHAKCACDAAEANKHILLEKPIARNVDEAREIITAAERNSVKLMLAYPLRFNTSLNNLREQIESGSIGDVETAYATFVDSGPFRHRTQDHTPIPVPEWWFRKELSGGGALMDQGSHMINLLRWYFGEIVDIKGQLGYRFNMEFEDSALCIAKFDSGTRGIVNVGWFSQMYQQKIEVFGTVRHASVNNVPPKRLLAAIQMLTMNTTKFFRAHTAELEYFVRCISNDATPSPSGIDGLKDLQAIEQVYQNPNII